MAVNDKFEIKTYSQLNDQIGINVRHMLITFETGGGLTHTEIADGLSTQYASYIRAWLNEQANYIGMTLQLQNTPPFSAPVQTVLGSGAGFVAGDALPPQSAGLVHFKTLNSGQGGRGRMYLPFASESFNATGGKLGLDAESLLQAIGLFWLGPRTVRVGTAAVDLTGQLRKRTTNVYTPVIRAIADDRWATQRRRSGFGRQNPIPFS